MFSLQQFVAFAAQLQCKVFGTEEHDGLMLAHTEHGCVYSDGTQTCSIEGEQHDGEVFKGEELHGYYEVEGEKMTLTLRNDTVLQYSNNDEGWATMVKAVLA
jgi:hypothetical protein